MRVAKNRRIHKFHFCVARGSASEPRAEDGFAAAGKFSEDFCVKSLRAPPRGRNQRDTNFHEWSGESV
jgi:hypothetical protein